MVVMLGWVLSTCTALTEAVLASSLPTGYIDIPGTQIACLQFIKYIFNISDLLPIFTIYFGNILSISGFV